MCKLSVVFICLPYSNTDLFQERKGMPASNFIFFAVLMITVCPSHCSEKEYL